MCENDLVIKCEILISIIKNILKFKDKEFIIFLNNKISDFFEINFTKDNKIYRDKLFFTLIEEIANQSIEDKFYSNLIKNLIKKYVLIYDRDITTSPGEIHKNVKIEKINLENILENIVDINKVFRFHNENNLMTDFIAYLIRNLYDGNISSKNDKINNNEIKTGNNQKETNILNFNSNYSTISNLNISISKIY